MSSKIQLQRICEYCGNPFTAQTTVTRFCSHKCNSQAYKARIRKSNIERSNTEKEKILTKPIEDLNTKFFLSIDEVCQLVGITRKTVYNLIHKGDLKFGKFGNRTIIRRADIEALLNRYITLTPKAVAPTSTEYYTVKEIEAIYSIKYGRLNEIVNQQHIPKRISGGKLYLPKNLIDRYFAKVKGDIGSIKEWYSVDEVINKYGLTRDSVYRITSEKQIPKKREGKYNLLSKWHIDNLGLIEPSKK